MVIAYVYVCGGIVCVWSLNLEGVRGNSGEIHSVVCFYSISWKYETSTCVAWLVQRVWLWMRIKRESCGNGWLTQYHNVCATSAFQTVEFWLKMHSLVGRFVLPYTIPVFRCFVLFSLFPATDNRCQRIAIVTSSLIFVIHLIVSFCVWSVDKFVCMLTWQRCYCY